jgi:3-oxoacyl-[acyl-carrier protein] reductase
MNEFEKKIILITGSSSGLGYGLTSEFVKIGSKIIATGNTNVKRIKKLANKNRKKIFLHFYDLTDSKNINILCSKIKKENKKIDAIIHCLGGGFGLVDPLINMDDLLKLYKLNIAIGAEINRNLVPILNPKKSNIIHIGSTTSVQGIGSVGYSTMKAGLLAYSKTLAINLIKKKIYVNTIMPGAFIAPGNHFERMKEKNPLFFKEFTTKRIKIEKISTYKDIFPLIKLLISDEGKMLSGSNILIDACETNCY